jgi:hypothetical protein
MMIGIDSRHTFDPGFVSGLPVLKEYDGVAATVLFIVDGFVALVASKEEIREIVQLVVRNPLIAARSGRAERIDMSRLSDIHRFLSHRILPEG